MTSGTGDLSGDSNINDMTHMCLVASQRKHWTAALLFVKQFLFRTCGEPYMTGTYSTLFILQSASTPRTAAHADAAPAAM